MADTVRIKNDAYYVPTSGKPIHVNPDAVTISMTGTDFMQSTQLIGTSDEAITEEEIGTPGWVLIENLDSTNFVEIGLTGSYSMKLLAGDPPASFRVAASLFAKADTAAVQIRKTFFEV